MHPRDKGSRRLHHWRYLAALAASTALVAVSGCGARWSDEEHAALLARHEGGASEGPAAAREGSAARNGASTATSTPGATADAAPGAQPSASDGDAGAAADAAGPAPCSAPSDAPGVTGDEISIGTVSTVSGPVPGLGASALGAVRAYVAYRNSTGGVCGRQILLREADDGADNGQHRAIVSEMSSQVLGLAGGLAGGDAGSGHTVEERGLPVVSTAISDGFQNAATVFDINPPFADVNALIGKYKWLYEQGVRTVALVYLAVDQTRSEIEGKQKPQMQAAGIKVVNEQALPLSTLSYDSAARAVANSKADYLFFLADAGASASMARSMADTGYELKFGEYLTAYGSNFIDLAGDAAEGTSSWIRTLPNEDGGANPEQAAYLQWMGEVSPDVVVDTFAADSWAAAKAFLDALEALRGPITREALLAQLRATNPYDAGGFLGSIQLGAKLHNGCHVGMIVEGGAWRRLAPADGFLC
jgi:ABC-type branched-subunit amino acid transport system substrate-binding protein